MCAACQIRTVVRCSIRQVCNRSDVTFEHVSNENSSQLLRLSVATVEAGNESEPHAVFLCVCI